MISSIVLFYNYNYVPILKFYFLPQRGRKVDVSEATLRVLEIGVTTSSALGVALASFASDEATAWLEASDTGVLIALTDFVATAAEVQAPSSVQTPACPGRM